MKKNRPPEGLMPKPLFESLQRSHPYSYTDDERKQSVIHAIKKRKSDRKPVPWEWRKELIGIRLKDLCTAIKKYFQR